MVNWIGQYWSVRGEYIRTDADALIEFEEEDEHEEEEEEVDDHTDDLAVDDGDDHDEVFIKDSFDR